jgi:CRP/FNR family transcriptional regulator, cyclic AMP receptor protein
MDIHDIDFRSFAHGVGDIVTCKAGDVIFERGSFADAIWIVQSGSVSIEKDDKLIDKVGVNYAIGVLSIIDNGPRSGTARADEDSVLIRIDHAKFRFMMEEMPNFGWYVTRQLARRLRAATAVL